MPQTTTYSSLPSRSELPSIHRIVQNTSHPAWTAVDSSEHIIEFHHHGGQIPGEVPLTAWAQSLGSGFRVNYWNSTDDLKMHTNHPKSDQNTTLPSELSDLTDAIETELEARHRYYESYRLGSYTNSNHSRLPSDLTDRLEERFETIYDFLTTPRDEILSIDQMGEARYESMIEIPPLARRHNKGWCVYACCPACGADWYSPVSEQFEPTPHNIQTLLYCPACHNENIPSDYYLDPEPFLNNHIETAASATLTTHV